jgi:hypothetical protein
VANLPQCCFLGCGKFSTTFLELGIEPITRVFNDDPWSYVWSLNGQRRDLVGEQRYLIWKFCYEQSEAFQIKKKHIQEEANRKRSEAAKEQPRTKTGFAEKQVSGQSVHRPAPRPRARGNHHCGDTMFPHWFNSTPRPREREPGCTDRFDLGTNVPEPETTPLTGEQAVKSVLTASQAC